MVECVVWINSTLIFFVTLWILFIEFISTIFLLFGIDECESLTNEFKTCIVNGVP